MSVRDDRRPEAVTTTTTAAGGPRAPWVRTVAWLDGVWQRIEARLCVAVLLAEIGSLAVWIALKGLSSDYEPHGNLAGLLYRCAVSSAALGVIAHRATRSSDRRARRVVTGLALALGLPLGRLSAHLGVHYASNLLNWLQNASVLMLVGGLRGLATRLTLWVALLGASLAASRAKHIRVDVLARHLPGRLRGPASAAGRIAAAAVCLFGAIGFVDYISIAAYRAAAVEPCPGAVDGRQCDAPPAEKMATVRREVGTDLFLLGRQASLDARSLPRVLAGAPYDRWLTAADWNAWLDGADWAAHFDGAAVAAVHMDAAAPAATRMPQVPVPGTGEQARGLLVRELDFVFPFGLVAIALKLLLQALLVLAGHRGADADGPGHEPPRASSKAATVGLGLGGAAVTLVSSVAGPTAGLVVLLALLGAPLFAVMGGAAELLWLAHPDAAYHHLRFIAPTVLDERFADSPILVTIPLFTFIGYVLAEAGTPDRLVAFARTALGWMPGGLAIVAIVASAAFTVLTGGSGVTIIAIGGLLYPALRKQAYPEAFSLGLVTTGGSVGLLLPMSLPLLVYALVAHIDFNEAFKAVLVPGALVVLLLGAYAAWVGSKERVVREPPELARVGRAIWDLKWELGIPVLLAAGLGTGLTAIDEAAGLVALYTVVVEFFVHRDLTWRRDMVRVVKESMSLAGAILVVLAMANALMNYVVDQHLAAKVLQHMTGLGVRHMWQFLLVMNAFLLVLGMLMEGFSAILVAVPLIVPFVAKIGSTNPAEKMSPFQLAMIFLLNLEIAYCMPPLGLNLFLASFRFNRPVASLYRMVMPFVGILAVGLVLVTYVPWLSNVAVAGDIAIARKEAEKEGTAPRRAWMMQCVQEDPSDPQPCTPEDMAEFPGGQKAAPPQGTDGGAAPGHDDEPQGTGCNPDFDDCSDAGGK